MKIRNNNKKQALPQATTLTNTPAHSPTLPHTHMCVCIAKGYGKRINQKYAAQIGQSKVTKSLWQQ